MKEILYDIYYLENDGTRSYFSIGLTEKEVRSYLNSTIKEEYKDHEAENHKALIIERETDHE